MLHVERGTPQPSAATSPMGIQEPPSAGQQQPSGNNMVSNHTSMETHVLLSTAVVRVKDSNGGLQVCRIFLDTGSQGTFISEDCVRRLGLIRHHSNLTVTGISSSSAGVTKGKVQVSLHNHEEVNIHIQVEAHILPKVTGYLPKQLCRNLSWSHLVGLQLADPHFNEPGPVDMLIGADYVGQLIKTGIRRGDISAHIAQETLFGWVLSGRVPVADSPTIISHVVEMDTDSILRKFWEVEEPPTVRTLTKEEKLCEANFIENYSRDPKGRIVVGVPVNDKKKQLGESRGIAIRRLLQVERRLKKIPHCQQQYVDFMRAYEALGQMTKLPPQLSSEVVGSTNYLPHHFVINDSSTTTKLRVVFDGSAKTSSGVSLNDTLMVGATLQDDLYSLLLRFRLHNIVLKGDITKMFRQFRLRPEDAEFHRIVWRESPDLPILDYRLETVTYGTAYAPFLATRSLQQVAVESKEKYPSAAAALYDDSYVDDLMSGEATTAKTINLYNELNAAVGEFGLEFRKWSSNDPAVLEAIPEEMRETDPHSFDDDQTIKALGVQWNPTTDSFTFKHVKPNMCDKLTKRILLSDLSRVFDPLGFLGAVTIRAKLLLQELWKLAIGWDEPISTSVREQWERYQEDMKLIVDVQIPRLVTSSSATRYELQGFSDASERAYGAVVYLRVIDINKTVSVNLLTSKTRVAPIRQITLPRLELMGAVLLAELIVYVCESLKLDCDITCWCDSTITLRWIAAEPRRWKPFVANRVSKIQELIPIEAWKHVPGSTNPADLASRGVSAAEIINNTFWWNGPSWLTEPTLPIFPFSAEMSGNPEERNLPTLLHHVHYDVSILERFSSLIRMKRVVAHILRLSYNKRNSLQKRAGPLTPMELHTALLQCVIIAQQQSFKKELQFLKKSSTLPNSSKLRSLHPYLDSQGILRVSGRLHNSNLPEKRKHQIILSPESHLSKLIINYVHCVNFHSGFQLTWSTIQSEYWILNGRDKIRHFIRSCVICREHRAKVAEQLMGNLPEARVTPARPFLHTGVDYAGPFILKNPIGRAPKTYKGYMCFFVCMATKAIHLEAVSSLSTEAFLATLRRFVSRRGLCAHIYSDCGTNFVGAEKELKSFIRQREINNAIADQMTSNGVSWHFNPPSAPHQGGLLEAGVKSAKHHLRRVVGNSILSYENFQTILCQVEAILNSRPLHPLSPDPSDFGALTPGHFLIGEPLTSVPDLDLVDVKPNRLSMFQQQQQRVQHFWKRWSQEYLNTLQQRTKWYWEQENLQPGDLVLVKEDVSSVGSWKLGRIAEVHPGADGRVRVVTLKTTTSTLQRPIAKLIPLLSNSN